MGQDRFDEWFIGLRRWGDGGQSTRREGREKRPWPPILHDEGTPSEGRVGRDVEVEMKDVEMVMRESFIRDLTREVVHSATAQGVDTGDEEAAQEEG